MKFSASLARLTFIALLSLLASPSLPAQTTESIALPQTGSGALGSITFADGPWLMATVHDKAAAILNPILALPIDAPDATDAAGETDAPPGEVVSQIVVSRPSRRAIFTLDSADTRLHLDARETLALNLALRNPNRTTRFIAPNGGSINGEGGRVEVAASTAQTIDLSFTAGATRGRYTLEVIQGRSTQILEFWVGPEPPLGQPGPKRTFSHR